MCSIPARFSISLALLVSVSAHGQSFLYQLQNLNISNAAASSFNLIVTDYSHDGGGAGELTTNEVATLKAGKTVLAYLSIGEAENYRFYWNPAWLTNQRPAWLGPVDPSWPGNYKVKYWDPAWQAIVFSYLDRILAQGFDGAYLDIVDGYEFWESKYPTAAADMVSFVKAIAAHARTVKPGFLIFPQNGSALLTNADYLATISGIGNEDTWFNGDKRQNSAETAFVTGFLDLVVKAGKPVLAIDYVRKQPNIDAFYSVAEAKGYTPYASVRDLNQLVLNLHHDHVTSLVVTPVTPVDRSDVRPDAPPSFGWTAPGALLFQLNFAGDEALTKVVSTATFSATSYTPTVSEWVAVMKLPTSGQLWWWVTARDGNQVYRSSVARRLHRLHTNISTTYFWVGEPGDADNHFIPNDASAWDDLWKQHYGGVDDPTARDPLHPYWPAGFTPQENPFYCALPYNDFDRHGNPRRDLIPWARFVNYGPLESALKNQWVKIYFGGKACYAQWEDVGPFGENDAKYVFGTKRPKQKANQHAGLDVSPAVKDYLGLTGLNPTDWRFVFPGEVIPPGPWSEIITTNQIAWLP